MSKSITEYVKECYQHSVDNGWYTDLETGEPLVRNDGERLMLIVSEVAEAMEGLRKDLMDDHLPDRSMAEVELADTLIRVFDFCGSKGYDLEGAVEAKLSYNKSRKDHKLENRKLGNGKKF